MEEEPFGYEPPDRATDRRRRHDARRSAGLAFAYIVVVAIILGAAFGCPGGEETVSQITTTTDSEVETTTTSTTAPGPLTFTARLTGGQQVPPVTTSATGTLTFVIADDGSKVDYEFRVTDLVGVTLARLRQGQAGEEGENIMILYDGPRTGSFTGTLAEGSFTAEDLEGPLKGKTIEDLVVMIMAGDVYFNVGTSTHAGGEIRGQLE
jgi:hypothetical protein